MKKKLIKRIIDICYSSNEGHIPSSLSILDILIVLFSKIEIDKNHVILSKGHAALGLYAVMEHFGFLEEPLDNFCKFNSKLGGHPSNKINNIECSTGSLGHGLPIGVGMAMAEKILKTDKKTYVIIGDGESNEGTIWESSLLACQHKLNNLYCILDYNHSNDRALMLNNIKDKMISFGWDCLEVDGHNQKEIYDSLLTKSDKPIFIVANTIKGKGCGIMENNPEWHHKTPSHNEYIKIINSI